MALFLFTLNRWVSLNNWGAATFFTSSNGLFQTARLNDVDPQAWLGDVQIETFHSVSGRSWTTMETIIAAGVLPPAYIRSGTGIARSCSPLTIVRRNTSAQTARRCRSVSSFSFLIGYLW